MKTGIKKIVIRAALLLMLGGACISAGESGKEAKAGSVAHRGVWVAFYEFYSAGLTNRTEAAFRVNAKKMFKKIKAYGCNEVYFHVRSFDDAIYPSKVVGWSKYISTDKKPLSYDPLKILVELAHEKNLKFFAWMNPYRVTTKKILNPAKTKSINRIVKQVKEIVNNYDVDGIHFDDYFYLGSKYNKVKAKTKRKNVNKMVKKVYKTVKAKSKKLLFSISPAGNYEYSMSIGGDVTTWMSKSGYVDYIMPQLYWSDKYKLNGKYVKLFSERLAYWRSMNKLDLPMIIGLGLCRANAKVPPDNGWKKSKNNLSKQLKAIKSGNTEGYCLFSYSDLTAKAKTTEMKKFLAELAWIKLNKTKITLKKGETFKLTAKWMPSKYKAGGKIKFKSLDEKLATVDKKGNITAVAGEGTVKIQAVCGSKKKNCVVTLE